MNKNIIVGSNLLETITSALYENPIILFREYVQNSLDAYNESTRNSGKLALQNFHVKINIEKQDRTIVIEDNGYGILSDEQFSTKMLSFGNSDKSDRTQFIGFRGIGRISALPFCKTLKFISKAEGSDHENICIWNGESYRNILNDAFSEHSTFDEVVDEIVEIKEQTVLGQETQHYFKVIIEDYTYEIEEIQDNPNFEQNLRKLLPLRYSEDFSVSSKIIEKYSEFMNEDLTAFMCSVFFNGDELKKNYCNDHILDSNVVFWELREKNGTKDQLGDKLGVLWFTFNRKISSTKNISDYGILVRSKNILMGNNDTFADLCTNSKEYVGTYRELTSTLQGVYGELLINSANLKDNARREWFRTDEHSIYLKYIIIDFMKRLYEYRYASSRFFRKSNDGKNNKLKAELKEALVNLVDVNTNPFNINEFYEDEAKIAEKEQEKEETHSKENSNSQSHPNTSYANEDMPRANQTKKKTYDELMVAIQVFFEKENKYNLFLKLRAYIKNYFQE